MEKQLDPKILEKFPGIRPENYQIPESVRVGVQEFSAGLLADSDFDGDAEEDLEYSRKLLMQVRISLATLTLPVACPVTSKFTNVAARRYQ